MTISSLCREAVLRISAHKFQTIFIAILLSLLAFGVSLTESLSASAYRTEIQEAVESGAGIIVARADGGVDNNLCKRIEGISGVEKVGMLYEKRSSPTEKTPGSLITVSKVDGNFMSIIFGTYFEPSSKYAATDKLIREFGGTTIELSGDGGQQDLQKVSSTPISEGMNRWVFQDYKTSSEIAECWIKISPTLESDVTPAVTSFLYEAEGLSLEKISDANIMSIESRWILRQSQYYWLAAGALIGIISCSSIFIRRHEYFLYITLGFSRIESMLVAVIELFLLQIISYIFALSLLSTVSPIINFAFYGFSYGVASVMRILYLGLGVSLLLCFLVVSGKELRNMKRDK